MPPLIQPLPAQNYRRERWRNGHGWTRQILRQPDEEAFHWRTSIAEIGQDTLFSLYLMGWTPPPTDGIAMCQIAASPGGIVRKPK